MTKDKYYPYLNSKGEIYASIDSIDRSSDVELDLVTNYQELISEHLQEKVPFAIADKSGRVYNDVVFADFSNNKFIRFICKWVNPGYTTEIPTFGNFDSKTGLVEITLSYEKLAAFIQLDPPIDGEMMMKLKEKYPSIYNMWLNGNKEEVCEVATFMAKKVTGGEK